MAGSQTQPTTALSPLSLIVLTWIYAAFATLAVGTRTLIRIRINGGLAWDDYCVYLALVCLLTMSIMYMWAIPIIYNLEAVVHQEVAPAPNFISSTGLYLRLQFGIILLFWTCLWAVKASFLIFYKQIFRNTHGKMIYAWWTVATFCALAYIGCWINQFLACTPVSSYFTVGQCATPEDILNSNISLWYSTAVDVLCDLMIMALPLHILQGLHLDIRRKLALLSVFGAGILIVIFATLRVIFTSPHNQQVNPVWLAIWSQTEVFVAVVVASTPTFRTLLARRKSPASSHKYDHSSGSSRCACGHEEKFSGRQSLTSTVQSVSRTRSTEHMKTGVRITHEVATDSLSEV